MVNHKVPLAHGGEDIDSNTENLCTRHDAIVTAKQFGKSALVTSKVIGRDGRPTSPGSPCNNAQRKTRFSQWTKHNPALA
jgi:5-methylcytosine-specific restriction protein A